MFNESQPPYTKSRSLCNTHANHTGNIRMWLEITFKNLCIFGLANNLYIWMAECQTHYVQGKR